MSIYCRSLSLSTRQLSAVCFQKIQDIHRTSHMCLSELRLYVVCASACVISCCVVFVCLIIYLSVHMTGLGPGRGVILQWSACNSRTEHRREQRWTGSDQTETTRVILTDPLWLQQRCATEVFYSILLYSLYSFYICIYTLSHKHKSTLLTDSICTKITFFL